MLPEMIQTNDLELRRWNDLFVEEMIEAILFSLPELVNWMPWAQTTPSREEMGSVFAKGRSDFDAGLAWNYGLFERMTGELVGSAGVHREDDRDCPEIGYWIRTDRIGRGYATQAARALTQAAFANLSDVGQLKICTDQANLVSAAVAQKIGCHLAGVEKQPIEAKSHTGTVCVWILRRSDQEVTIN